MTADKQAALQRIGESNEQFAASLRNPDPAGGLSIVIPTYNALGIVDTLLTQLNALEDVQNGHYEVVITDDASTDGTVPRLREQYPQFSYVESSVNTGFGANANRGIAAASKAYTALVNTDIELIGNPFPALLEALHADDRRFALMPLVFNTATDKVENLQTLLVKRGLAWNADLPREAESSLAVRRYLAVAKQRGGPSGFESDHLILHSILCGACFVCTTAALREAEGFSSLFAPFYWEDVDLGWRFRRYTGDFAVGVLTSELVLHRHSESISKAHGMRRFRFLRLNQLRFVLRHLYPCRELRNARGWWLLRGLRESFGGAPELRDAYFRAAFGARTV